MWDKLQSVEGKIFWKNGYTEIWYEDELYKVYSYKPSGGKRMEYIESFDTLEKAQFFGEFTINRYYSSSQ